MIRSILVMSIVAAASVSANPPTFFTENDVTRFFFSSKLSCGGVSRLKKVSLTNPSPIVNDCQYTIKPANLRICKIRIDFDTVLAQPRLLDNQSYPRCLDDVFRVNNIEICGVNTKQHIYVPFDVRRLTDSFSIQMNIADRGRNPNLGNDMSWSATVRQIECPDKGFIPTYNKLLAPDGCLQYHLEGNGTIESFNFNQGNGPYLGNLSYAICIKRPSPNAQLTLKTIAFGLNKALPSGNGYDAECVTQINTKGTSEDHIAIAEAVQHAENDTRASKFCGNSLQNSTLTVDAAGPFIIYFHSDTRYDHLNNTERGFKFEYGMV